MTRQVRLANIMVDCDDAQKLQQFYSKLLGWEQSILYGHRAVRNLDEIVFLFEQIPGYIPPIWTEKAGQQQKQMHFDFQVSDLDEYVNKATSLGAVKAIEQFGENNFVTMIDPAGHPFCLCKMDKRT